MSAYDKNKIFFGLIHYILSEQHNVDWILKTSLVNFTGLNTTISNKKFKQNSVTDDIIEYIYQIKPYHVQFEQFIEKHSSKDDIANIDATDTNNIEIKVRFDAIQPYADVEKTFDLYLGISDDNDLPTYEDEDSRNVEGYTIFSAFYNSFYVRHYDEETKVWSWVQLDEELLSDKYYYAPDVLYKVINENGTKILKALSREDEFKFMETHKANRLWYLKREIFKNKAEMDEYITDILNAHFKGISVDGSKFDFGNMGYDAFLYDEKLYDEPTISNDFCLVDFSEPSLKFDYKKSFVKVGLKTLYIDSDEEILEGNCKVYYEDGNDAGMIENFTIKDNLLTLPHTLKMYEKIKVINTVDGFRTGYVFVAHPFSENENLDDSLIRKFKDINDTDDNDNLVFEIPENNIGSRKVLVYLIKPNGSKHIVSNFEERNGCVILNNQLFENDRVQVTVIDYRRIYDKIYTWEDRYGNSNNVIALDGDKFLRANYEAGRPPELAVSYPLDGSMIYKETDSGEKELYQINWKNDQSKMSISPSMKTTLSKDINLGDTTIEVENINKLFKPTKNKNGKINPAKLLINSEIIEYHEIEKNGNKGILKGIRRASSGSILNEYIPVEYTDEKGTHLTEVYAYGDHSSIDYNPRSTYISTLFKEGMENKFIIPSKFLENSKVVVYKKPLITLLTDITFESKYFDISSNNIVLPAKKKLCHIKDVDDNNIAYDDFNNRIGKLSEGNVLNDNDEIIATFNKYGYVYDLNEYDDGYLYINGDKVYYKTITKVQGKYRIKDFSIEKEYKSNESIIYGDRYEILNPEEYEIICNQNEDIREHMYIDYNWVYNPITKEPVGIFIEEDNKKAVYKISDSDEKLGFLDVDGYIKNNKGVVIGTVSPEWNNLGIDLENNILGYIKSDNNVYKFSGNILGYINEKDDVIVEKGNIVGYGKEKGNIIGNIGGTKKLAYNDKGDVIGWVDDNNAVYDFEGKKLGDVNDEGKIIDIEGQVIGKVGKKGKVAYGNDEKVIGWIDKNSDVYSNNNEKIGHVNDRDKLIEYPYEILYKDAYVILNETPRPMEVIVIGNEI